MKKIILFRHGQTDWNVQGLVQGHTDIPLNQQGQSQAEALGKLLKAEGIEHIYSSDLQRAAQTAHIVSTYVQCSITTMQDLREMHYGIVQGKTKTSIQDHPFFLHWSSDHPALEDLSFEGGETKRQAKERARLVVQTILATSSHSTIAISSHGVFTQYLLGALLNASIASIGRLDNAKYHVLKKVPGGWSF